MSIVECIIFDIFSLYVVPGHFLYGLYGKSHFQDF